MAIAVVCGRFLLGAGAGVVISAVWVRLSTRFSWVWHANPGPEWLFTGWGFLGIVLGCGLVGVSLPTMARLARAALSRLPFLNRYNWS